jgi:uncharacterized membrane protein
MENLSLQFQGVRDVGLLATVMTVVALALAAQGVWHLFRGRRRQGALRLAAALPAAFALLLAGQISLGLWMAALGVQIALAVGIFYAAVYAYLGRRRLAVLMVLRCAAIAALLLVLFKPALSIAPSLDSRRPPLAVLVDRSQSMATPDAAGGASRYLQCLRELQRQEPRLRQSFRPVYYHFAQGLQPAESLDALTRLQPAGEGTDVTDIAGAVRSAADYHKAEQGAIVLFSDGIHNASTDLPRALREALVPVYVVGVGSGAEGQTGRRNLQIASVEAPFDAIRNNVSTLRVTVKATGLEHVPAEVQLLEDGNVVASAPIQAEGGDSTISADLKWTPREPAAPLAAPPAGTGASRPAAVGPAGGPPAAAGRTADVRKLKLFLPPAPQEALTQDNELPLHVLVTEPKIRLLYVEGTIRPEYKFLWRALNMDPQVQLISLVRVQKSEFSVTGSIGGRTLKDLPRTDEDFRLFDVIVLGDIDSTFFTPDQLARLKKFVMDGGGLLMLGGHNSFGPGGYGGTDVEAVLPVLTGGRNQGQETAPMLPLVTAEGAAHPILDGIADYFPTPRGAPQRTEPNLPPLLGCVKVAAAKPGASILAVHPAHTDEIVLAAQPFGAGRSAAFTADTTWQWFMTLQGQGEESPYRLFWGQMVRWLANVSTKNRTGSASMVLRLDSPYVKAGTEVKLSARVLDEGGKAPSGATVTCSVEPAPTPGATGGAPGGAGKAPPPETVTLSFQQSSGLFTGTYRPRKEGQYVLRAVAAPGAAGPAAPAGPGVADAAGQKTLASDELPLSVWPQSTELDKLARDEARLQMIAKVTGGRYADVTALPEIIDQIVDRQRTLAAPAPKGTTHVLYNFPLLFLVFVALLTGEWLLRRSWQLH